MKCTIKVPHKDIEKFREIQKLRKQIEDFSKSSNKFEIINTELPIITIEAQEIISQYTPENEKQSRFTKEQAYKKIAMYLGDYIINHQLCEIKEFQDNFCEIPNFKIRATLKVVKNND